MTTPPKMWPGRVAATPQGNYLVDGSWAVVETQNLWEAWPLPDCASARFDIDEYRATRMPSEHTGRATAEDLVRSLIGDPR
ncbi:hypothetical protein ACIA5D_36655 [Actinoplanes sp. NPDC051513]|uniref:hypothetical protein n=1 Tax=Actinoplanes sp. NPDC051513 TaxID=3363908 RepID=UPI0037AEFE4C